MHLTPLQSTPPWNISTFPTQHLPFFIPIQPAPPPNGWACILNFKPKICCGEEMKVWGEYFTFISEISVPQILCVLCDYQVRQNNLILGSLMCVYSHHDNVAKYECMSCNQLNGVMPVIGWTFALPTRLTCTLEPMVGLYAMFDTDNLWYSWLWILGGSGPFVFGK